MIQTNPNQSPTGQSQNGNSNDTLVINPHASPQEEEKKEPIDLDTSKFEKNVVLRQSATWSRAITWTIMGVTVFAITWAAIAKIEQVIPARGQLKPKGTVKEIQAPINGVVKSVEIEDGEYIKEGETLLIFDSEATQAELESLQKIRQSLLQENRFYRTLMNSNLTAPMIERAIVELKLPLEIQALAVNRTSLVEENKLFAIELSGGGNVAGLKPQQAARIAASQAELNSRAAAARLEIEQLEKQLSQNQVQLSDALSILANDRQVLEEIKQRNKLSISQAEESLRIEQEILDNILPLAEEGALARIQIDRQRQQVQDRRAQLVEQKANGTIEYDNQQQQVITRLAEIEQLKEEQARIKLDIAQAREEFNNTIALSEKDLRERMAENNKRIAEIDSQINKIIIENEKRIAETNSQIRAAEQTIKYQELKAPVSGTVFDLQAGPGFVPKSGQAEALLKIVPDAGPDNPLIAEVYVTNEDIGFVQKGQITDVRIDSFPYSEFGDIKGKVYFVGSDALPPDEIYNFYRFPVKVELAQQYLMIRNEKVELQSGMSVSVNVKVKEKRTVLSLFTELFMKKVDSLKQAR
jgi:HlyD family secretion protein